MEVNFNEYLEHYFQMPQFLIFLGLAFALLAVCYCMFFLFSKARGGKRADKVIYEYYSLSERFHEMVFSGTSILFFIATYYLINRFVTTGDFRNFWDEYKDFLLLFLMVVSILFNTLLDRILVRLKHISPEERAAGRLVGMIYMIVIFCYIKFIYEDNNYDMFIAYFLTLMIGRFVYFDASFKDFLINFKNAILNIPLMMVLLCYTAIMCLYGFSTQYLIKHNGVITNIFFTHLFMCVAIFFLSRIAKVMVSKKVSKVKPAQGTKAHQATRNIESDYRPRERKNPERMNNPFGRYEQVDNNIDEMIDEIKIDISDI